MRIGCAYDHAGVPLREHVERAIRDAGHEPVDLGTCDDYPDSARDAGRALTSGEVGRCVVVCGSGAGIAVACNKITGVRAALGHDTYSAAQSVEHDDCNVLVLGARVIGPVYAEHCVRAFAAAEFSGEERHVRRLNKVLALEQEGA